MDTTPVEPDITKFTWYQRWREGCAWLFCLVVLHDFVIAPISTEIYIAFFHMQPFQWHPLTLEGGGMFYIAFGAILSIAGYGRMQENTEMIRNMPDFSTIPAAEHNKMQQ